MDLTFDISRHSLTIPLNHPLWDYLDNIWITEEMLCDIADYERFKIIVSKILKCTVKVVDWILMISKRILMTVVSGRVMIPLSNPALSLAMVLDNPWPGPKKSPIQ